jgi:hypothetical protein
VIESDTAFAIVAPASSSKCAFDDESGSDDSDREIKILNPKKTGGFITDTFQSVDIVTTIKGRNSIKKPLKHYFQKKTLVLQINR